MKNEIKNNIVHFFIGMVLACIIFGTVSLLWIDIPVVCVTHVVVFAVSIAIEIFQFFAWDNREWRMPDRVFDVIGYQIGVGLIDLYTRVILL